MRNTKRIRASAGSVCLPLAAFWMRNTKRIRASAGSAWCCPPSTGVAVGAPSVMPPVYDGWKICSGGPPGVVFEGVSDRGSALSFFLLSADWPADSWRGCFLVLQNVELSLIFVSRLSRMQNCRQLLLSGSLECRTVVNFGFLVLENVEVSASLSFWILRI